MRFLKTNSIRILSLATSIIFSSNTMAQFTYLSGPSLEIAKNSMPTAFGYQVASGGQLSKEARNQVCEDFTKYLETAKPEDFRKSLNYSPSGYPSYNSTTIKVLRSTALDETWSTCGGAELCSELSDKFKGNSSHRHKVRSKCVDNLGSALDSEVPDMMAEAINDQFSGQARGEGKSDDENISPDANHNSFVNTLAFPKQAVTGIFGEQSPLQTPVATCTDKKNCYFKNSSGMEDGDCDLLNCSLGAEEPFATNRGFNQLFTQVLLGDKEKFEYKGDKTFCNNCLKKAYDRAAPTKGNTSFEEAKAKLEKKVKNTVASRLVAKNLMDWAGHLEFLKNREYLEGASSKNFENLSCAKDLSGLLKKGANPCGDAISDSDFNSRLHRAFEITGLPKFHQPEQFIAQVLPVIDEEKAGGSCRKAHALSRNLAFHHVKNKQHQLAVDYLFRAVQGNPLFEGVLGEDVCERGNFPEESFVNLISKKLGEEYANNILKPLIPGQMLDMNRDRCAGSELTSTLFCGEIEKSSAPEEVSELFGKITQKIDTSVSRTMHRLNEKTEWRGANLKIRGRVIQKAKREFSRGIRGIFNRPMAMDPNFRTAFGSWKNVCELKKKVESTGKTPVELINDLDTKEKNKNLREYYLATCSGLKKKLEKSLCSTPVLTPSEDRKDTDLSVIDIKIAQRRALKNLSDKEQFAANSIKCELNTETASYPDLYAAENAISFGKIGEDYPISDLESKLAVEDDEVKDKYKRHSPYKAFLEQQDKPKGLACASDHLEHLIKLTRGERSRETARSRTLQDSYEKNIRNTNTVLADKNQEQAKEDSKASALPALPDFPGSYGGGVNPEAENPFENTKTNSPNTRSSASVPTGGGSPSISVSQTASSNSIEESSSSESIRSLPSSVSRVSESQDNGNFQNLFGYLNNGQDSINPSYGTQSSANYQISNSGLGQNAVKSASSNINCDANCVDQLKGLNSSSVDINQAADVLGVKGIQSSSDDLKQMFSDVLDGKLDNQALDELREENKKLREEMLSIKQELETKAKPVKVLDSNGIDRSSSFKAPESNSNIVFNPRNSEANEFRSRSYYENKKDAFAPNYSDNSAPERVSLGEYSAQRRAASTGMSPERVKKYSGDIDRTFLQANSSRTVDDAFVKKYVEHVDKSSGSIEHLLVYENGRPTRIRVPDPDSPGEYIEQPIAESLVEDILEKVEKDEMNSYAVYNMVNFGQSLEQFMSSLETEKSNLTSLSTLNSKLDELRNMAQ